MFNDPYHIYALRDPRNNEVRYVGVTCTSLKERLANHFNGRRSKRQYNHPKNIWLRELDALGLKPLIEELEILPEWNIYKANALEAKWGMRFLNEGHKLTNQILTNTYSVRPPARPKRTATHEN